LITKYTNIFSILIVLALNVFGNNLKVLRKASDLTQQQLAEKLGINRATLASYEEGRAEPKFDSLKRIASFFKVSIDDLLQKSKAARTDFKKWEQKDLQILPIVLDQNDQERITLVSKKASAGYLRGLEDPQFIEELPSFSLPFDKVDQGSFRAFEIEGDSMLPIPSGSYIIARFEDDWRAIRDDDPYIVVSQNDGLSYKRVELDMRKELISLHSDNKGYDSYSLPLFEVRELWKAIGYISFDLNTSGSSTQDINEISKVLFDLKREVEELKSSKNH